MSVVLELWPLMTIRHEVLPMMQHLPVSGTVAASTTQSDKPTGMCQVGHVQELANWLKETEREQSLI